MRLFAVLVVVLGLGSAADAQVFKPKTKKADTSEKRPAKSAAKKSTKAKKKKKQSKAVSASRKSPAAERGRPNDLTPDPPSKDQDEDYVKITDDDDIE